jgi:hypothetical protein
MSRHELTQAVIAALSDDAISTSIVLKVFMKPVTTKPTEKNEYNFFFHADQAIQWLPTGDLEDKWAGYVDFCLEHPTISNNTNTKCADQEWQ